MVRLVPGAVVDPVPETRRPFNQDTCIRRATGKTTRAETVVDAGYGFGKASRVAEEWRSVADVLVRGRIEIRSPAGILGAL